MPHTDSGACAPKAIARLKRACENAKRQLSSQPEARVEVWWCGGEVEVWRCSRASHCLWELGVGSRRSESGFVAPAPLAPWSNLAPLAVGRGGDGGKQLCLRKAAQLCTKALHGLKQTFKWMGMFWLILRPKSWGQPSTIGCVRGGGQVVPYLILCPTLTSLSFRVPPSRCDFGSQVDNIAEGFDFSEKITRAKFEELNLDLFRSAPHAARPPLWPAPPTAL